MSEFKTVRGMRDLLSEDTKIMKYVEDKARRTAELYGFKEIITPIVESYELLSAKAGEEVKSRMFVFRDLGDRKVALRPEFTASIARLVATTLRNEPKPLRLLSIGSVYRYDEPQKGRYREFWQSNFELMGSNRPEADAEILMLTDTLMKGIGLRDYAFKIGHVGVLRGILSQEKLDDKVQNAVMQMMDKKLYDDALRIIQGTGASEKCVTTIQELVKLKSNRISDITGKMKELVRDYKKATEATENLQEILKLVSSAGNHGNMTVDAGFARGLEYYTGLIFEIYVPHMDIALGGGGRYDKLIEMFGGEPTPAVGVAHGIDRIMLALQEQKSPLDTNIKKTVIVIPINEEARSEALRISKKLRDECIPVEVEIMGRKMAKTLEDANRRKLDYAIIIGEKELKEGVVAIRNLTKREQKIVRTEKIIETIKDEVQS